MPDLYSASNLSPAQRRVYRFAVAALVLTVAVVLWGAFVRATGAGAGCGSHWPLCNGAAVPHSPAAETLIEYTHRLTSGLALLAVVALWWMTRKVFPAGHGARRWAIWSLVFMLTEAAIGAGLVLFELVADNDSMTRAAVIATHLGNTLLLLGAQTLTVHYAGGGAPLDRRARPRLARLTTWAVVAMIAIGASGAIAALGDTLFPASSLSEAFRQDLSPTAHLLIRLRTFHPLIAVLGSLLLFQLVVRVRKIPSKPVRRHANRLNGLVIVQLLAGGVNVFLLAPVWMQLIHLLLADLVWIALVTTTAHALSAPTTEPAGRPREPTAAMVTGDAG